MISFQSTEDSINVVYNTTAFAWYPGHWKFFIDPRCGIDCDEVASEWARLYTLTLQCSQAAFHMLAYGAYNRTETYVHRHRGATGPDPVQCSSSCCAAARAEMFLALPTRRRMRLWAETVRLSECTLVVAMKWKDRTAIVSPSCSRNVCYLLWWCVYRLHSASYQLHSWDRNVKMRQNWQRRPATDDCECNARPTKR